MSEPGTLLDWVIGLPMNMAVGIGVAYALIMGIKWALDFVANKGRNDPETALRDDLMEAHREVRREVQELRKELADAYDKVRGMAVELNSLREGLASFRVELHHLKTEHPDAEKVIHNIIERLGEAIEQANGSNANK